MASANPKTPPAAGPPPISARGSIPHTPPPRSTQAVTGAGQPSRPGERSMPGAAISSDGAEVLPRQFGKYTLLRELASGGMAKVYLAIQRAVAGFEKLVVVKRILPELARDRNFVEMLLAEARTAATLSHQNIVQTFDVGEIEGTYFIAMEHINGEDIRSIVRAMKKSNVNEFPLEHTLSIISGMCAGLAYAHDKRGLDGELLHIVHRDVSPQNILVTFTGDVKIVDFGIAKTNQAAIGEKTAAGQLKGKVPYMSPEQARGEAIDHRSDVFAVGIMLFELTTGRRLFKAKSDYETLRLICDRDYPRPSQVRQGYPAALEAIVMRALEKDREKRYPSARDMQSDLESFIREEKIAASTVSMSTWMNFLFEEKIAQQKTVLQDVKQLADVIASQHSDPGDWSREPGTVGAATVTQTDVQAITEIKKRQTRIYAVMAVMFVALCAGGVAVWMRISQQPLAARQAAAAPAPAPQKRGKLSVKTEPPGAYVRIAGEIAGQTPLVKELPTDIDLEVRISKDGYESVDSNVKFSADKLADAIDVKLVKGTVTLAFTVEPKEATLMLDEKAIALPAGGWTKDNAKLDELSAGEHKAVFSAPGYLPEIVKWTAKKGETKKLDVHLKKGEATAAKGEASAAASTPAAGGHGTVNVASRGGYCATTLVNGRNVGPTPVAGISVNAGPVSVICKTADGKTVGGGGMVKDGETARISVVIPN